MCRKNSTNTKIIFHSEKVCNLKMSYKNFFKILFILLQNLTIYSIKEQIFNQ